MSSVSLPLRISVTSKQLCAKESLHLLEGEGGVGQEAVKAT